MDRAEHLRKRFAVQKVARHDDAWVPLTTVIQGAGASRQTTVEFARASRNTEVKAEEFDAENIRKPVPDPLRETKN